MATFPFRFVSAYRLVGLAFGVTPRSVHVEVGDDLLVARFGPWLVRTPVANVAGTELTGPYRRVTTIGPAHLSLSDRGSHSPPIPTPASASASGSRWPVSIRGGVCATRA